VTLYRRGGFLFCAEMSQQQKEAATKKILIFCLTRQRHFWQNTAYMRITTPTIRNLRTPEIATRGFLLIPMLLACFALLPRAQAVVPAPDGGYPGNNTAEGTNALFNLTIGINNTAVGANALFHDTTGGYNVAIGSRALENNSIGNFNMAIGTQALFSNTASANMAVGFRVLYFNTTGNNLTGIGTGALYKNTNGNDNTAIGSGALNSNTTGARNTAVGRQALLSNTNSDTTAVGYQALFNNTGERNCAFGSQALFHNTTAGNASNAFGYQALFNSTGTSSFNNAFGWEALHNVNTGSNNTAIGDGAGGAINAGNGNTCLGATAGTSITTANGVVAIGLTGANVDNTTYIRNVGTDTVNGAGTDFVTVNLATGRVGHVASSRRYKENIKPMDNASEALYRLKPVTYHYKKEIDPTQGLEYGLIAEDVDNVDPNLAIRDGKGQIESVRYTAVNAMLLNEFLKEHRKVEELEATVAQQQKGMEVLAASLKEQAAQIQKVSAQLEVKKPAPKVVRNNP